MNCYYQRGGGGADDHIFRGYPYMQGYGLGANFRRFFRWIVPLVQKHAVPALKSGVTEVGKSALGAISELARDAANGRNIKEAADERINTAVQEIKQKIEKKLEGRGKKKRPANRKSKLIKRKKYDDIFDQE